MIDRRTDGRVQRGEATRRAVLRRAADIASVEGLEGVSIGRLAAELRISKSGVFAHFGSKEELQLATVETAADIMREAVVEPTMRRPAGIGRVFGFCEIWLDYSERRTFPGGCFFFATAAEFDARPGRVRDAIAAVRERWGGWIAQLIEEARQLGEIAPDTDIRQLIFELQAVGGAANAASLLHDDKDAYRQARVAMLARLRSVATRPRTLPTA